MSNGFPVAAFLLLLIVVILFNDWQNNALAPSNIFKQFNAAQQPKSITITLTDLYAVGKGGSLFVGQYNDYNYIGYDDKDLIFHFINNNDYEYHIAKVNATATFVCYGDLVHCE